MEEKYNENIKRKLMKNIEKERKEREKKERARKDTERTGKESKGKKFQVNIKDY